MQIERCLSAQHSSSHCTPTAGGAMRNAGGFHRWSSYLPSVLVKRPQRSVDRDPQVPQLQAENSDTQHERLLRHSHLPSPHAETRWCSLLSLQQQSYTASCAEDVEPSSDGDSSSALTCVMYALDSTAPDGRRSNTDCRETSCSSCAPSECHLKTISHDAEMLSRRNGDPSLCISSDMTMRGHDSHARTVRTQPPCMETWSEAASRQVTMLERLRSSWGCMKVS